MKIFTPPAATHFARTFSSAPTTVATDVKDFLNRAGGKKIFVETTPEFSELRDCMIREAERYAFLSANIYAASLRVLRASAAFWSIVGLYYSTFYAAKALLEMHGGWIDGPNRWLEVSKSNPGSLELSFYKTEHPNLQGLKNKGSHKGFWLIFYHAITPLHPYIKAKTAFALKPIHSSATWLIDNRNDFNYKPMHALQLMRDFAGRFNGARLPDSFPGDLKVFLNVASAMQEIVQDVRREKRLVGDDFRGMPANFDDAVDVFVRAAREPELETFSANKIASFAI